MRSKTRSRAYYHRHLAKRSPIAPNTSRPNRRAFCGIYREPRVVEEPGRVGSGAQKRRRHRDLFAGARLSAEVLAADVIVAERSQGSPDHLRTSQSDFLTVAVGIIVVGLLAVLSVRDAGIAPTDWIPGGLLFTGLTASVIFGAGGLPRRLARPELLAVLLICGLTLWALASITWAGIPGDAWDGANRMIMYCAVFILFVLLPWRATSASVVLTAYVLGTAAIGVLSLERAASNSGHFIDGRLAFPTGYPNANAALFLSAYWVALVLATRRSTPVAVRVLSAAAAAFLPQVAILSQSRGSIVAFSVTAAVLLIALPGRIRTFAGIVATGIIVAVTWRTHAAVFDAGLSGSDRLEHAIGRSAFVMFLAVAAAALLMLGWVAIDGRVELSQRMERLLHRSGWFALVLASAAISVAAIQAHPISQGRQALETFTVEDFTDSTKPHLSAGVGSNRYDFWRVAILRFGEHPVTGIGADNFAVEYLKSRRSNEEPTYPHSLWVMMLSQFGIVGAVLFAGFLTSAAIAAFPRRHGDPRSVALGGAALAGSLYFFIHASVDWFWEIPALGASALALLGLAVSVRSSALGERRTKVRLRRSAMGAVALAVGLAAASLTLPWLSYRQIEMAVGVWGSNPALAYRQLARARQLNPLSAQPDLIAGAIAARLGDQPRMRALFSRSLERNPQSWYAELELGLAESLDGNRGGAVAAIQRAIDLNPRESILKDVLRRLEQGERIAPRSLDRLFRDRITARAT